MADINAPLNPLQSLAAQNPVQNNRIAQGLQAARQTGLQQQVAAAPAVVSNPRAAQQVGAQQAAQAGQIQLNTAAQTVDTQGKLAKEGLTEQAKQAQLEMGKKSLDMKVRADQLANKLYQVDKGLKNKLIDQTIQFEKDDMGRTLFNERQLLDYKLKSQKSDIALQQYEQQAKQLSDKRTQMLQAALRKIEQTETQQQQAGQQKLSQQQTQRLAQAKINIEKKMRDEAARQKNRAGMFGAVLGVVGGVVGAVYGGPTGAVAGASLGSGVGTVLAGT